MSYLISQPGPWECPAGHVTHYVLTSWYVCYCGGSYLDGHKTFRCPQCRATVYEPPCTDPDSPRYSTGTASS